ncbi:aldo-keto reductase [Pseudovirgaria hyperparasitica]|uniref:Aldo-keto reductase n=1 Tax=Pseudovirgaria hyperparasitica TaxID=470096 RepID=A0A6A6WGS9_9PEZI|nr:aldo-keto reductase [Pseudovirgaria hyperparasitica]KAF2761176.1 aldo-keto reductase [Pseudovirgaria hyperparasitica]
MDSNSLPTEFDIGEGLKMPSIGIGTGTFKGDGQDRVKAIVLAALKKGYRHIDTATAYGTEKAVGEAIKEFIKDSGVPREELFVTTKLDQNWHKPSDVAEAMARSLESLDLDYVDLYMMHFSHAYQSSGNDRIKERHENGKPKIDYDLSRAYPEVWKSMEALVHTKKARSIGVSNFNIRKLQRLLKDADIPPAVNQVEIHPYLPQYELISFCHDKNIHVTAHQPLGGAPIDAVKEHKDIPVPLLHPKIITLAGKLDLTPAQVLLSWLLTRGLSAVPKTSQESRLQENLCKSLQKLSPESLQTVDQVYKETGEIRYLQPRDYIGFDIFDEKHDEPTEQ